MRISFTRQAIPADRLIRILIIAAIFLLSIMLGMESPYLPYKWVFIGIGAVIFVIIVLRNMMLGLTLLVATSSVFSLSFSSGRSSPIPYGMVAMAFLAGLWLLQMLVRDRDIYLKPSPVNLPFFGFLLAALLSWLVGYAIWDPSIKAPSNFLVIQAGQVTIFVLSIAALILAANQAIQERYLIWWTLIVIGIGTFAIFYRILIKPDFAQNLITFSMLCWPFVLLWGQLLFNRDLKPWMRAIGLLVTAAWFYWVYTQSFSWKGGWVPALLAFIFMLWFKNKRLFIVIGVISILLLAVNWKWFNRSVVSGEVQSGSTVRPVLWYDVVRLTMRSPIFGLGPVSYKFYWQDPNFVPLSRFDANWDAWDEWGYSPPSHSTLFDVFAQTGIVGLGFFIWGIVASLWLCYRIARRVKPGFQQAYVYAVLCGFASITITSFVFADFILPFVYNLTITQFRTSVYSWLILGSVIGFDYTIRGEINNQNA